MIQLPGYQSLLSNRTVFPWATKRSMSYASSGFNIPPNSSVVTSPDPPFVLGTSIAGADQWLGWNVVIAKLIYWVLVPLFQYAAAMVLADTMQYFTHRVFHVNRWLYSNPLNAPNHQAPPCADCFTEHVHSMHHDIYVPFAYGAFYNHPLETIPIDGVLFPMCLSIARLDNRQAAFFGIIWTFKTVVDHCGYDIPYNPCNIVCPNSVLYHDLQ